MRKKKRNTTENIKSETQYLNNILNLVKKLEMDTKIVAYSRFNKVKRLKVESNLSLLSISLLSFVLIITSIVEQMLNIGSIYVFFSYSLPIWYFSIVSSIFILVISVYISKNQYDIQITKLYTSAVRVNTISRKLGGLLYAPTSVHQMYNMYLSLLGCYNKILDQDHINHDTIDYIIAKNKYSKTISKTKIFLFIISNITTYYIIIIIASVFILTSISAQALKLC